MVISLGHVARAQLCGTPRDPRPGEEFPRAPKLGMETAESPKNVTSGNELHPLEK